MTQNTTPPPPSTGTGVTDAAVPELEAEQTEAAAPNQQRERVRDESLSVLQGMFPDFDEALL